MTGPGPERPSNLDAALDQLENDELVAFPTETVWGLAARACSPVAIARLIAFKGRASDQPISVLIDGEDSLAALGVPRTPMITGLVQAFWPGPLTLVVGGAPEDFFAPGIAGKTGAVGFRCSDHPLTAALVEAASERGLGPLTATSFNRSGETAVENAADAVLLANSSADPRVFVLDAQAADAFKQAPSTVVDVSTEAPQVLRYGAIDAESVAAVLDRFRNATQRR